MARFFNRAASLMGLRELALRAGHDPVPALRAAGLDPNVLGRPDQRIDYDLLCALMENCARDWDMPDFALRLAPYQQLEVIGPVGLAVRVSPDVRTALNAISENLVIHSSGLASYVEETGDTAAVVIEMHPSPSGNRQYSLLSLCVAKNSIAQIYGAKVPLLKVTLTNTDGGARAAAEAFFGCRVRFGAERNAFYFDTAILDHRIGRRDVAYHDLIKRYLAATRQEFLGRTSDAVRFEIARHMELGQCTLDVVAHSLRQEPRSLQRRLKQEGTSFRDLVDEWRRARAVMLVTRTRIPLSEISLTLGYSDQSIFSRAFVRWFGMAPLDYRKRETRLIASH